VSVDERGQVHLRDPAPPHPPHDEETIQEAQQRWDDFQGRIDDLVWRFRQFYVLDAAPDFATMSERLGGKRMPAPAEGHELGRRFGNQHLPGQVDGHESQRRHEVGRQDAFDSLYLAWDGYLRHVDAMIDESEWYDGPEWSGSAAVVFHDRFLNPFSDKNMRRTLYVQELAVAADCLDFVVTEAGKDLNWIADHCIDALVNGPGGIPAAQKNAFSWASFVSGVAATIPSPYAALAGGVGVITGGFSLLPEEREILKPQQGPAEPVLQIVPTSVWTVLESGWLAMGKLDQYVDRLDEIIKRGLETDVDALYRGGGPRLERPDLADGEGDFGQLTSPPGLAPGVPLHRQAVVISLVRLYAAGRVNLPSAAKLYEDANDAVDECTVPPAFEPFMPRSVAQFKEARNDLSLILRQGVFDLNDVGEALIDIAKETELTDEESAQTLQRLMNMVDSGDKNSELPLPESYPRVPFDDDRPLVPRGGSY
jgi:hypothetical protein